MTVKVLKCKWEKTNATQVILYAYRIIPVYLFVFISSKSKTMYTIAHYLIWSLHTRGSRFLSYNFLQSAIDGKNNSKTKVEKAFFFIFVSSYAEMRF
jgi:hypothetical protein